MVWESFNWHQIFSLQASSPFGGYREKYTRERHARGDATLAASPLAHAFSRGSLRSPKQESLLAGYQIFERDFAW